MLSFLENPPNPPQQSLVFIRAINPAKWVIKYFIALGAVKSHDLWSRSKRVLTTPGATYNLLNRDTKM